MRQTLTTTLTTVFALGTLVGFLATERWSARAFEGEAASTSSTEEERPIQDMTTAQQHPTILIAKELESSRGETLRYREGLERAVEELNRMARECRSQAPPAFQVTEEKTEERTGRKRRAGRGSLRLKGPKLQPWDEDLVAFGSIQNRGEGDEVAELLLELVHDGRVIDEEQLSLHVVAGDEVSFEHTFWAGKLEGTYRIRGRLLS